MPFVVKCIITVVSEWASTDLKTQAYCEIQMIFFGGGNFNQNCGNLFGKNLNGKDINIKNNLLAYVLINNGHTNMDKSRAQV